MEIAEKFPPAFGDRAAAWLTFKLKEEIPNAALIDHEFELFRQASQADRERVLRQGRVLKGVATVIVLLLVIFAGVALVMLVRKRQAHGSFSAPPAKIQRK